MCLITPGPSNKGMAGPHTYVHVMFMYRFTGTYRGTVRTSNRSDILSAILARICMILANYLTISQEFNCFLGKDF